MERAADLIEHAMNAPSAEESYVRLRALDARLNQGKPASSPTQLLKTWRGGAGVESKLANWHWQLADSAFSIQHLAIQHPRFGSLQSPSHSLVIRAKRGSWFGCRVREK